MQALVDELSYAGNEAARRYLNGEIDRARRPRVAERVRADAARRAREQRVRFFDTYRSYVINYNLGKDLVRQYIESRGGTADTGRQALGGVRARCSSSPRLPSGLK